jgi:hypothetical protein
VVVGDYCPGRPSMGHMEVALARSSHGQEADQEVVGSLSSPTMIREVGRMEVDILVHVVVVSCRTMKVEDHLEVAGMKVAARLVPVVDF